MKSKRYTRKEKNRNYWRERFEQLEESQVNEGYDYYQEIKHQYQVALVNIEKDIMSWYYRLALNNEASLTEVKKLLNSKELSELKWTIEEYIKYGKENAINQMWMKQLENASAKAHITRLEALKLQVQQHLEVLYSKEVDGVEGLMKNIYADGYYHTAFEVAKGIGVATNFAKLDNNRISKVIRKPWTTDGINFSERIWGKHRPQLINELHTQLTQMIIRGEDPQHAIDYIAKQFDVSKNQAGNLIMTESAFFAAESKKDCFNDLGVELFEVVATLDLKTSKICQALDGEVFDMKDYEVGVTSPPFHNFCRTTTAPYFEDEEEFGTRFARDSDGNVYYVDSNMKYSEWYDKYVKTNEKEVLTEKKIKNAYSDKEQHKKYKDVLGKEIPKSFDKFQEVKYNNINEWDKLKVAYKDQNIRNTIKSNELPKDILIGKQGKHILGHNNYIEGRSYMKISVEELQKIVNDYAGTGYILRDNKGQWNNKELIEADKILGVTFDNEGNARETQKAIIHYSKKGTHVVPTLREVRK
jgi:SPP1 gp7 family putative phage head morphogenesis protein